MAVKTLRKENVVASHAFEAGDYVEVGVVEGVSHVEIATRIRRRSINTIDWTFRVIPVETIDAHLFPFLLPFFLDFEDVAFFGQWFHVLISTRLGFCLGD